MARGTIIDLKPKVSDSRSIDLDELCIAIPLGELGYSAFWQWLMSLTGFGYVVEQGNVVTVSGAYIAQAHNKTVKEFLARERKCKAILWLEHDHRFPSDIIMRMLAPSDYDVLGALYFGRTAPYEAVCYKRDPENPDHVRRPTELEVIDVLRSTEPVPMDVVGMGCTLVRREVYEKLGEQGVPWYAVQTHSNETDFGEIDSDDAWFCRHAIDAGFKIGMLGGVEISHMVMSEIGSNVYFAYKNMERQARARADADAAAIAAAEAKREKRAARKAKVV